MDPTSTATTTSYYIGQRGDQYFGFDARQVRESSRFGQITRLPETHPNLVGVVNLRNTVLAILLPDIWFQTEPQAYDPLKPVAVIESGSTQVALQLDSVLGVYPIPHTEHLPHPYQYETPHFNHLASLQDGLLVTIINIKLLFKEIHSTIL